MFKKRDPEDIDLPATPATKRRPRYPTLLISNHSTSPTVPHLFSHLSSSSPPLISSQISQYLTLYPSPTSHPFIFHYLLSHNLLTYPLLTQLQLQITELTQLLHHPTFDKDLLSKLVLKNIQEEGIGDKEGVCGLLRELFLGHHFRDGVRGVGETFYELFFYLLRNDENREELIRTTAAHLPGYLLTDSHCTPFLFDHSLTIPSLLPTLYQFLLSLFSSALIPPLHLQLHIVSTLLPLLPLFPTLPHPLLFQYLCLKMKSVHPPMRRQATSALFSFPTTCQMVSPFILKDIFTEQQANNRGVLLQVLEDEYKVVRKMGIGLLERYMEELGREEVKRIVLDMINDENDEVRREALGGMVRIGEVYEVSRQEMEMVFSPLRERERVLRHVCYKVLEIMEVCYQESGREEGKSKDKDKGEEKKKEVEMEEEKEGKQKQVGSESEGEGSPNSGQINEEEQYHSTQQLQIQPEPQNCEDQQQQHQQIMVQEQQQPSAKQVSEFQEYQQQIPPQKQSKRQNIGKKENKEQEVVEQKLSLKEYYENFIKSESENEEQNESKSQISIQSQQSLISHQKSQNLIPQNQLQNQPTTSLLQNYFTLDNPSPQSQPHSPSPSHHSSLPFFEFIHPETTQDYKKRQKKVLNFIDKLFAEYNGSKADKKFFYRVLVGVGRKYGDVVRNNIYRFFPGEGGERQGSTGAQKQVEQVPLIVQEILPVTQQPLKPQQSQPQSQTPPQPNWKNFFHKAKIILISNSFSPSYQQGMQTYASILPPYFSNHFLYIKDMQPYAFPQPSTPSSQPSNYDFFPSLFSTPCFTLTHNPSSLFPSYKQMILTQQHFLSSLPLNQYTRKQRFLLHLLDIAGEFHSLQLSLREGDTEGVMWTEKCKEIFVLMTGVRSRWKEWCLPMFEVLGVVVFQYFVMGRMRRVGWYGREGREMLGLGLRMVEYYLGVSYHKGNELLLALRGAILGWLANPVPPASLIPQLASLLLAYPTFQPFYNELHSMPPPESLIEPVYEIDLDTAEFKLYKVFKIHLQIMGDERQEAEIYRLRVWSKGKQEGKMMRLGGGDEKELELKEERKRIYDVEGRLEEGDGEIERVECLKRVEWGGALRGEEGERMRRVVGLRGRSIVVAEETFDEKKEKEKEMEKRREKMQIRDREEEKLGVETEQQHQQKQQQGQNQQKQKQQEQKQYYEEQQQQPLEIEQGIDPL